LQAEAPLVDPEPQAEPISAFNFLSEMTEAAPPPAPEPTPQDRFSHLADLMSLTDPSGLASAASSSGYGR
jgi:hypothetical protein